MRKFYTFVILLTAMLCGFYHTAWGASPLLVASGSSTSNYVPISGNYTDQVGTRTQVIYPSSLLTEMDGKEITGLKFYSSQSSVSYSGVVIKIRLAEVNVTTLSGFLSPAFTEVYSGGIGISSYEMNFVLSDAYLYGGGNLLLETEVVTAGSYNFPYFYGVSQTSAAYGNKVYYGSAGVSSFLPKTSFTYAAPAVVACPKPKSLAGDAVSSSSATITWKKGGSETAWDLQYSSNNGVSWTTLNLTTSNVSVDGSGNCTYTLSGLSAQTTYKVQIRANCGGGDGESVYTSAVSFTTFCAAISSFPWTETFESGTANTFMNCWDNSSSTTSDVSSYYTWGVYSYGGNKMLRMNNYWVHSGSALINTPTINLPAAPELTFKYAHNASCGTFYVKISTNNGVSFSNIGSYSKGSNSDRDNPVSFTTATINLSTYANQSVIIQFYASANYGSGAIFIDDVHIESTQDCSKPSTPVASDVTGTEAHVSWTAKTGVTSYKYIYKTSSTAPTSSDWESASTTSNIYVDLAGLTDGTTYYFWVMCACGTVASDACSFTPLSCPTVTGVTLSNKVYNGVRVNWTTSSATNCDVRYSTNGGSTWTAAGSDISATYKDITVSIGNTYTFAVKPHCGGDGTWKTAAETYTPTCPTPGALSLSGEKFNGVTISWSAVAGVSEYNLRYRKGSDSWTEVNNFDALTYTISSGLVTDQEYTIQLQTECAGGWSSITYTPEAADPAVVSANSITETTVAPAWTDMSAEGAIGYQYIIVARDAAVDWSMATTVGSGTTSVSVTSLTLGTDYDLYVRTKYSASIFSPGKKKQFTTKVEKPTGLTKGTVTAYTAQFSWTAGGGATEYQYLCLPSGTTPTDSHWESSTLVNTTSATATGLSANTTYIFYVRAYHNGKTSVKVSSAEFKTDCGAVSIDAEHPWTYNFNSDSYGSGVIPECWSRQRSSYSASPSYSYPYITNYSGRSNSNCLVFAGGYTYGNNDIILPPFGVALSDLALSFYYKNGTYDCTESDPQFEAGYYSTEGDPSTFISLGKLTRLSSWTKAEYDLADAPSTAKNIVIRFGFESGTTTYNSTSAYIDDIEVKLSDGCSKPVNPSCTATTRSSATLRWTSREVDSWQIQYSVNSDFSSSTTVDAATNPFTITGLSSNTQYYARVRGYCDEEYTDWSITSVAFHTDCGEIASDDLPWSYGFETNTLTGSGNIPQCWKSISVDLDDYWGEPYTYPYVYDISAHTGSNLLYFYGGVTGTSDEYAILPEMEDDLKDLTIEFYHKELFSASDYAQFTVGYLTDVTDASTFVPVQAITRNAEYTQAKVAMSSSVPTTVHNFVILFSGGSSDTYGYIDDIKVYPTAAVFTNADGDNLWSNDDNWLMGAAPTISDDAIIRKPVTIDAGTKAVAKSVVVDQISTRTGEIAIEATGELVIADTLRRVTGTVRTKTFSPTTENDLYIGSTTSGNGGLVIGTHNGTNKATIDFYTKSYGEKEQNTSVAQYVGTPYNDETNILYNWYNSWVYGIEYTDGNIGWKRIEEGEGMNPFEGYCVFSADAWDEGSQKEGGHTYWMQGTLVSSDNHTCSGLNWKSGAGTEDGNNENLLANSWSAPIKIRAFDASDFVNADATIYIFNSTSNSAYVSIDGNYTAYPINTAATTATIPSMQSFSVFTNASVGSSVTLNYKRLVYDPAVEGLAIEANRAPRRESHEADDQDETDRMYLYVTSDSEFSDVVYLIENDECTSGFDNGWDGRKLFGESYAPQLYVQTSDGKMSVNCSPAIEGTVVGLTKGDEDDAYTFTFDYNERYEWYLNDLHEQVSTRISPDYSYRFFATADDAARFIISRTPINGVTTRIDNGTGAYNSANVRKLLINDILYIIRDGRMFDATGVVVR